jgi:HSP20 family protein
MTPVVRNQNWLPNLFNEFFGDDWMNMQHKHTSVPAMNIVEKGNEFCVEIAAPGTTRDDFKVKVTEDNELLISLEKRNEKQTPDENTTTDTQNPVYLRREFSYTSFQQRFTLPDDIDREKISAKAENGVLTIVLPKKEPQAKTEESHLIDIK